MNVILVLADRRPPADLLAALAETCAAVEVRSPAEILIGSALRPDVLLADAELTPDCVAEVRDRIAATHPAPAVLVYTSDDASVLEGHARSGFDYLAPPFATELVRVRVQTCVDRAALADEVLASQLSSNERELSIGREIQQGFLPESLPPSEGWDISVRFHPARQVAGDFYDIFELVNGRRLALIVADVCDKGVGAALFMALIRSLLRFSVEHSGVQSLFAGHHAGGIPAAGATPLLDAVSGTNDYLTRNHLKQAYFATLFFGVLDPVSGRLIYINGGHNPPLLMRANGDGPATLDPTGPAVGVLPGSEFEIGSVRLGRGDALFIYTDGVTEARDESGAFLGDARLRAALSTPATSADDLVTRVETLLAGHAGNAEQNDDITMLAVHRSG